MKKYLIPAFLLLVASNAFAQQLPIDSIKAIIKREVASKRSKSIIVGIIDSSGRRFFSEGILSDENPIPPDSNTIYEIGSITKVFTSLALADLSLKHRLNLTDPISRFLPKNVKTPTRNNKEISLLSLSTHRAGFYRNAYNIDSKDLDNPYADYTVAQLYEFLSTTELNRDIDTKWQYSNIGYALLGHVLTIAAHKDFETLINNDICKPLHMNSTVFRLTPALKRNLAPGHTEYGKPAHAWDLLPLAGGGGQRSNASDMLTFAAANLAMVKTPLLPAMELTHVQQAKKDGNDGYVTLGWTLWNDNGREILFKDGGTGGYRTFIGIDKKKKIGVVVLSNSNNLITDIGLHILDSTYRVRPYKYPWSLLDTLRATVTSKGTPAAIALYQQLKEQQQKDSTNTTFAFNENQLNYLGSELRREKKIKEAIQIFELNAKEYPASTLMYESLGETYKRNNNKKAAIPYFEKGREIDPKNPHWEYILNKLKK